MGQSTLFPISENKQISATKVVVDNGGEGQGHGGDVQLGARSPAQSRADSRAQSQAERRESTYCPLQSNTNTLSYTFTLSYTSSYTSTLFHTLMHTNILKYPLCSRLFITLSNNLANKTKPSVITPISSIVWY